MIKSVLEQDKHQMIEIAKQNFTDELPSTLLLIDCIKNNDYIFLGNYEDDILACYLIAISSIDDVCIVSIATRNEYKRNGYAKELIYYLKNITKNKSISLEVKTTNNTAISLYEKCGFKAISVRKKYYKDGTDAVCMFLY